MYEKYIGRCFCLSFLLGDDRLNDRWQIMTLLTSDQLEEHSFEIRRIECVTLSYHKETRTMTLFYMQTVQLKSISGLNIPVCLSVD